MNSGILSKWMFPKIAVPPNHPFLIWFSIINHPFWDTLVFFWKHPNQLGQDFLEYPCLFWAEERHPSPFRSRTWGEEESKRVGGWTNPFEQIWVNRKIGLYFLGLWALGVGTFRLPIIFQWHLCPPPQPLHLSLGTSSTTGSRLQCCLSGQMCNLWQWMAFRIEPRSKITLMTFHWILVGL